MSTKPKRKTTLTVGYNLSPRGIKIIHYNGSQHAAYVHKNLLFNHNDAPIWSSNTPSLPPDGFHLPKYKRYQRPLMTVNSKSTTGQLSFGDHGSGQCLQAAIRIKTCFETYCNKNLPMFLEQVQKVKSWKDLPN